MAIQLVVPANLSAVNGASGKRYVPDAQGFITVDVQNDIESCVAAGCAFPSPASSSSDNLTAKSGGGQGSATPLAKALNRITTVAAGNDSVVLPASVRGLNIVVTNAAASNSANVFPASGEQINALGINGAFALAAGKTALFYCHSQGQWHSILTA